MEKKTTVSSVLGETETHDTEWDRLARECREQGGESLSCSEASG